MNSVVVAKKKKWIKKIDYQAFRMVLNFTFWLVLLMAAIIIVKLGNGKY